MNLDKFPDRFWSSLNLRVFAINDRNELPPNIWCICSVSINPTVIISSIQHVTMSVVWENQLIYVTAIYAATIYLARRSLCRNYSRFNNLLMVHGAI